MTLKRIVGLSLATMMLATTGLQANDTKIVKDGMGNPVKDSFGNCVLSPTGFSPEGCETAPPPPPPAPAPAPAPVPAPVPAPAPRPIEKVNLSSDANFAFDKADLKPAGKANLDQFLAKLAGAKVSSITIVGHTDSVGSDTYNQGLSERRAAAVADYLVSKGVPAAAIQASGKGETQPIADNKTKAGRAANRRVEVTANGSR